LGPFFFFSPGPQLPRTPKKLGATRTLPPGLPLGMKTGKRLFQNQPPRARSVFLRSRRLNARKPAGPAKPRACASGWVDRFFLAAQVRKGPPVGPCLAVLPHPNRSEAQGPGKWTPYMRSSAPKPLHALPPALARPVSPLPLALLIGVVQFCQPLARVAWPGAGWDFGRCAIGRRPSPKCPGPNAAGRRRLAPELSQNLPGDVPFWRAGNGLPRKPWAAMTPETRQPAWRPAPAPAAMGNQTCCATIPSSALAIDPR